MTSSRREQLEFLDYEYATNIERFDQLRADLVYPNRDYDSARSQLASVAIDGAVLVSSSMRDLASSDVIVRPESATSFEDFEAITNAHTYNALLIDGEHSVLLGISAIATGVSLSAGSDKARHGFELGERIIAQRARLNSVSLSSALVNARAHYDPIGITDLLERANIFYASGRKSMSPLARVPSSVGKHFDEISTRVYSDDNFDDSHVASFDIRGKKRGLFGRSRFDRQTAKIGDELAAKAADPDKANEVVEEIFDTFLGYRVLKMEDKETLLVARFAQTALKFYEIAGRSIPQIRDDPRIKQLRIIVARLDGLDVPKTEAAYKKAANTVSREANRK